MNRISSSPAPAVVGSTRPAIISSSSRVRSLGGQT